MIQDAINLIQKYHNEQKYGQFPYTYHLYSVSSMVASYGLFTQTVALLHDILEDTTCSEAEIIKTFGEDVYNSVKWCSYDMSLPKTQRKQEFYDRWVSISHNFSQDHVIITASLVKVAGRLNNMNHCIAWMNEESFIRYMNEYEDFKEAVQLPNVGIKFWLELEEIMLKYY